MLFYLLAENPNPFIAHYYARVAGGSYRRGGPYFIFITWIIVTHRKLL